MRKPKGPARSAPVCRLLFLKLKAQNEREKFAFCSVKGCERIKIKALIPKNAGISDCAATAYPRFTEKAIVDVPMPRKLFGSLLVSGRRPAEPRAPQGPLRTSAPLLKPFPMAEGLQGSEGANQPLSWTLDLRNMTPALGFCFSSRRQRTTSWRCRWRVPSSASSTC